MAEAAAQARAAGRDRQPPPAGWQSPGAEAMAARDDELDALIDAAARRCATGSRPSSSSGWSTALRELLLGVRALIDWYLERLERPRARARRGPGHPDPLRRRSRPAGPTIEPACPGVWTLARSRPGRSDRVDAPRVTASRAHELRSRRRRSAARRVAPDAATRWRKLPPERRLAALAASCCS